METVTLSLPTVHCQACKLNIEESLDELEGLSANDVDLDAKTVTVSFDPDKVDLGRISAAIREAGYPVSA
jgi:copper ion binding protein